MGKGTHKVVSKSVFGILTWLLPVNKKIMGQGAEDTHNPAAVVRWGLVHLGCSDSGYVPRKNTPAPAWISPHLFSTRREGSVRWGSILLGIYGIADVGQ